MTVSLGYMGVEEGVFVGFGGTDPLVSSEGDIPSCRKSPNGRVKGLNDVRQLCEADDGLEIMGTAILEIFGKPDVSEDETQRESTNQ